jgi:hypothetical protein
MKRKPPVSNPATQSLSTKERRKNLPQKSDNSPKTFSKRLWDIFEVLRWGKTLYDIVRFLI